jgi:hypothetical protein
VFVYVSVYVSVYRSRDPGFRGLFRRRGNLLTVNLALYALHHTGSHLVFKSLRLKLFVHPLIDDRLPRALKRLARIMRQSATNDG